VVVKSTEATDCPLQAPPFAWKAHPLVILGKDLYGFCGGDGFCREKNTSRPISYLLLGVDIPHFKNGSK
jgi:hypothetical protein